jgi:hypothetical protein
MDQESLNICQERANGMGKQCDDFFFFVFPDLHFLKLIDEIFLQLSQLHTLVL